MRIVKIKSMNFYNNIILMRSLVYAEKISGMKKKPLGSVRFRVGQGEDFVLHPGPEWGTGHAIPTPPRPAVISGAHQLITGYWLLVATVFFTVATVFFVL